MQAVTRTLLEHIFCSLSFAVPFIQLALPLHWQIFPSIRFTVSQTCNEDGMEFTLRTPEGFYGRIYTYGFYDR